MNGDWASVAGDMLDDVTRTTRLTGSARDEATLAGGVRVTWHLDQGAYADTFGRMHVLLPSPTPKTAEAALAGLKAQVSAQIRGLATSEQTALFVRLEQEKDADLNHAQNVFTTAAENALRDANSDSDVRRAARHFLSFAMGYNDWDLDALARHSPG